MTPAAPEAVSSVWITGVGGLIGGTLFRQLREEHPGLRIVAPRRSELDLTDASRVRAFHQRTKADLIFHCAALSQSSACEEEPQAAQQINVEATRTLAALPGHPRLVFFSTDLVFDGARGGYSEDDPTHPLGVYARSKLEAEAVLRSHPRALILRTSLQAGPSPGGTRGFDEALLEAWRAGRTTPLFADEFRCPLPASATARAAWDLAAQERWGLLHLAGRDRLSRLDIGHWVARAHPGVTPRIQVSALKEWQGAPRPADVSLNCSRAQAHLDWPLPGLAT